MADYSRDDDSASDSASTSHTPPPTKKTKSEIHRDDDGEISVGGGAGAAAPIAKLASSVVSFESSDGETGGRRRGSTGYDDGLSPRSSSRLPPDDDGDAEEVTNPSNKRPDRSDVVAGLLLLGDAGTPQQGCCCYCSGSSAASQAGRCVCGEEVETDKTGETKTWDDRFRELRRFRSDRGHCRVPKEYPKNQALSDWVQSQRSQPALSAATASSRLHREEEGGDSSRRKTKTTTQMTNVSLSECRRAKLDDLGFEWTARQRRGDPATWEHRFEELRSFRRRRGHCSVPQTFLENQPLSNWVQNQRRAYKFLMAGRPSLMTDERRSKLEDLGFVWDAREAYLRVKPPCPDGASASSDSEKRWNERFAELAKFRQDNGGSCRVRNDRPDRQALFNWVQWQRAAYRLAKEGERTNLTEERRRRLESIGFEWTESRNAPDV